MKIKTGAITADGDEEEISEYFCDWPGCSNIATIVLGVARDIGISAVVCDDHAPGAGR